MADTNALAVIGQHSEFISREDIDLLKQTICVGATDLEFALFLKQVQRTRLDPFAGQIHAVKRWNKKANRDVMVIQTGIAGFELIAQRTGEYGGQDGPYWCGEDGVWRDVWLSDDYPKAARVGVYRTGFVKPLYAVALWREYVEKTRDGSVTHMWSSKPTLMLAKCAEAMALRKAFPQEMSGIYTDTEMMQAGPAVNFDGTPVVVEGEIIDADTGVITSSSRTTTQTQPAQKQANVQNDPPVSQQAINGMHARAAKVNMGHEEVKAIVLHKFPGLTSTKELTGRMLFELNKVLDDPELAAEALYEATSGDPPDIIDAEVSDDDQRFLNSLPPARS